jgi:hypothetical protein
MSEPIRENSILAEELETTDDLEKQLLSPLFDLPREAIFVVVAVDGFDPDRPVSEAYKEKEPGLDRLPAVVREAIDSRRIYVDGSGRWVWREAGTGLCRPDSHLQGCSLQGYLRLPSYNPRVNRWVINRVHEVIETRRMHFRWRLKLTRSERIRRVEAARAEAQAACRSGGESAKKPVAPGSEGAAPKLVNGQRYKIGDIAAHYGVRVDNLRPKLNLKDNNKPHRLIKDNHWDQSGTNAPYWFRWCREVQAAFEDAVARIQHAAK